MSDADLYNRIREIWCDLIDLGNSENVDLVACVHINNQVNKLKDIAESLLPQESE